MDEDRRRSARSMSRKRPAARPEIRPTAIWVISVALALVGLVCAYAGVTEFAGAIEHGDEEARVPSLLAALLGGLTIVFAIALFFGAAWGRSGAVTVCVVMFGAAVVGLMAEAISTGVAMIVFVVTLCVFFALLGPKAHAWTGGGSW